MIKIPVEPQKPKPNYTEVYQKMHLHSIIQMIIIAPSTRVAIICATKEGFDKLSNSINSIIEQPIYEDIVEQNRSDLIKFMNNSEIKLWVQTDVSIRGYNPHIKIIDDINNIDPKIYSYAIRPMGRRTCFTQVNFISLP